MSSLLNVLIKAICLVLMIVLGYTLKKVGFFKKDDFRVLSRIVLDITLPCAIIVNFSSFSVEVSLITLAVLGLLCNVLLAAAGYFWGRKGGPESKAFGMVNCAGYNIGCFTMPYVQSFLGPIAVVAACLFDAGNAIACNGGTYGVASCVGTGGKFSFKAVGRKLITSVPFITYMVMLVVSVLHLPTPGPVLTFAGIVGNANSFMAMLMLGVGFELKLEKRYLSKIGTALLVRYAISTVFALCFYFLLPFSLEVRQVAAIVAFAPVSSASVPYTGKMNGDVGLAGAINSSSIVISLTIITVLLMVMGL